MKSKPLTVSSDELETWRGLMADASEAAQRRDTAMRGRRRRAASKWRNVSQMLLVTMAVLGFTFLYVLSARLPSGLPVEEQKQDLAWLVRDAVDVVEARVMTGGSWPEVSSIEGLLPEALTYEATVDGYRIIAEAGDVKLEYQSTQDPEFWILATLSESVNE